VHAFQAITSPEKTHGNGLLLRSGGLM